MSENKQLDRVKEITDQLEAGIHDLFESERYQQWLTTMSRFHDYSLNNTLLIAMQKPDATLVAGYTAWQKQFGRQVQKGEKGIRILAPAPYKEKVEMDKIDPDTNLPVLDENGDPVKEEQVVMRPAFKVVSVFDVSQTDGRELPSIGVNELTGNVEQFDTFFEAMKQICPVPIGFENIDKFKAVLESGIDIEESGLSGIINLTYSLDKYEIMPDVSDEYDLGYYWVHDSGVYDIKSMGPLADYIDYQAFGESIVDEEFGMFCEAGYVRDNGDSWNYEYAGDRDDIPSEYRLFNIGEESEMTVLLVEPGKEPKVITMGTDLESLQQTVNGYIQAVYPFEDRVAVICNDEGKINGMELNRALYTPEGEMYDILAGPFIIAGLTEDNFGSLTQEQIEKFSELFRTPEMFLMENGRIKAVPVKESDTFEIFQIDRNLPESRDISFVSYEGLRKMGKTPNKAYYSQVYTGNYAGESLDAIYERFNLYHPTDFRGHSVPFFYLLF